jgi:outer membrane protein OmpA-like peptidoglycan-associated protein
MQSEGARGGEATRVLDHVRLTVAALLAMLLLLLWWRGHGPYSSAACCPGEGSAEVSAATASAPTAGMAPEAEPPPAGVAIESTVSAPPPAAIASEPADAEPPPAVTEPAESESPPVAVEPAVSEPPPAATESSDAEPPYTLSDPNSQVRTDPVQLPRWEGWQPPVYAHDVYVPPERAALVDSVPVVDESPAPESAATAETAAAPSAEEPLAEVAPTPPTGEVGGEAVASPAYTIEDPNAQVRTLESALPEWTGPSYPELQHHVYYPPAPSAEAPPPIPADVPPAAKLYFQTAKWDLPADAGEKLAPIIRYLNDHPAARAVIQGFHDPRGSQELNVTLAKNRAGATWAALLSAGIARERIVLRQPLDSTGSGSLAEARRAEVSIQAE